MITLGISFCGPPEISGELISTLHFDLTTDEFRDSSSVIFVFASD